MLANRHASRFAAAYLALAGCGVASLAAVVLLSAQPAVASGGSAEGFVRRVVTEIAANEYGAAWQTLHPAHQRVAPEAEYVQCELRDPIPGHLQSLRVLDNRKEQVVVAGLAEPLEGRALDVRITIADRALDTAVVVDDTIHVVDVDGRWRWILPERRYELYRDDACGEGGPPPQVRS